MSDTEWFIDKRDWPAGARADDPTIGEIYAVLDQFDDYYPVAVAGLADPAVPRGH